MKRKRIGVIYIIFILALFFSVPSSNTYERNHLEYREGTLVANITSLSWDSLVYTKNVLKIGNTLNLNTYLIPNPYNASQDITWSSSNAAVASVNTVSGVVTAKSAGSAVIKATDNFTKKYVSITIQVQAKITYVGSLSFASSIRDKTLLVGKTFPVDSYLNYSPSNASADITYSSSNTAVASVNATTGLITAKKKGNAVIKATDNFTKRYATVTIYIEEPVAEKITCPNFSIYLGETKTYAATNNLNRSMTYSSTSPLLSINGKKVTANGYVSSNTTAYITVKSSSMTKSCSITVKPPEPTIIIPNDPDGNMTIVSTVSVSKKSLTLALGGNEKLSYTVQPSNASKHVVWETTNPNVATVASDGTVRAVGVGTTNIIVRSAYSPDAYSICYVTVTSNRVEVTSLQISPTTLTLEEGKTGTFQFRFSPSNANLTGVYYTSSDPSIATVTNNGLVKAIKAGRVTVTLRSKDGKKTSMATVVVNKKAASSIGQQPPGDNGMSTIVIPGNNNSDLYKSYDNTLMSLSVAGKDIYLGSYMPTIFVDHDVTQVAVKYEKSSAKATVKVTGNHNLVEGNNVIRIIVTAEIGDINIYRVVVVRRGKNNTVTSGIVQAQQENKEIKIITTEAPVVDMATIENVKDTNKLLVVNVQDASGKMLYEWNLDGSYLTYHEEGLNTKIDYQIHVPESLKELIDDENASYIKFEQQGALPSVAVINLYVKEKYSNDTSLYLYKKNDSTLDFQYGDIKVVDGYIQLRIYDGAEYILTPNFIRNATDSTIVILGILLFVILSLATAYLIYRNHRSR